MYKSLNNFNKWRELYVTSESEQSWKLKSKYQAKREYYTSITLAPNATRPLSRCYLRSYLVNNTTEAHKESSKKYKNNLRTLKSKSYKQCRTKHEYYNNKAPHFLSAGLQIFSNDKSFEHAQNHSSFHEFY